MPTLMQHYQVMTSTDSRLAARELAGTLLESRLAACVQIVGPIESHYWWKGNIESSEEWLCLMKTDGASLDTLITKVGELHSYETPEITATEIVAGDRRYLDWISEEVSRP